MPEYMSRRFGGQRIRVYLSLLSLILYIFTKCSVNLYTGAIFIQQALGWDIYLSIILQIGIVAVLTVTGGLTAVIYTDTLQAVLMIGGALSLMAKGFYDIGGFNELWRRYPLAVTNVTVPNTTCHLVNEKWNILLREASDPDLPWPGFLFGQTPGSIWYWCSDQVIVQRALAAKSLSHAQGATIMAAFAKILPLFMIVLPGMISRVLYTDEVGCVDPDVCLKVCQSRSGCTNIAYPKLVLGIMPTGAKGIMMAVILAALMSDLDSIFNSASTMFTIDIYQRIRSKAGTKELMIVGRLFVLVMVGVAVAWVPIVKETQGGQLFIYIQEVSLYLSPPIAAVYLLAILWPRCNEKGAFWGLMIGFVTGVTRLILIFVYPGPDGCGEPDERPSIIKDFHYMYFGIMLFWITVFSAVVVSMVTKAPEYKQLYRTTYWTRLHKENLAEVDSGNLVAVWGKFSTWFTVKRSAECATATQEKTSTIPTVMRNTAIVAPQIHDNGGFVLEQPSHNKDGLDQPWSVSERPENLYIEQDSLKHPNVEEFGDERNIQNQSIELSVISKTDENSAKASVNDNVVTSQPTVPTSDKPPAVQAPSTRNHYEEEDGGMTNKKMKEFCYSWICGVSSNAVEQSRMEQDLERMEKLEEEACSLEQDPRAKCALRLLLAAILAVGVGLYCFFSLWNYTVE